MVAKDAAWVGLVLSTIVGCLMMVAVAGEPLAEPARRLPADIVFVLDNSGSMKKHDPGFLVRVAVEQFATGAAEDTRIAMVIFDESVDLVTPLTFGAGGTSWPGFTNLEQLSYQGLASNISGGVDRALQELQRNGRQAAVRSVVLLTDGLSDSGDQALNIARARRLIDDLRAQPGGSGIHIFAVALADSAEFQLLRTLAMETGGEYFYAEHAEEIFPIFTRIYGTVSDEQALVAGQPALAVPAENSPARAAGSVMATDLTGSGARVVAAVEGAGQPPGGGWFVAVGAGLLLVGLMLTGLLLHRRRAWAVAGVPMAFPGSARRAARAVHGYLYDIGRVTKRKRYELSDRTVVIGRRAPRFAGTMMDAILIAKPTISRCHAVIEYREGGFWLRDEQSRNGTFVNGTRVAGETRLRHGDTIRFHDWDFEFQSVGFEEDYETVMVGHSARSQHPTDY